MILLGLNLPLHRFFYQERGVRFAVATIPWHWLYNSYNGLSIILGAWAHLQSRSQIAERGVQFETIHETEPRAAA